MNEQLVVVDANGVLLGPLITEYGSRPGLTTGGVVMLNNIDGLPSLPFLVERNFLGGSAQGVYFASSDCSGEPLLDPSYFYSYGDPLLRLRYTFFLEYAETVFYSETDIAPQATTVHSYLHPSGSGCVAITVDPPVLNAVPAISAPLEPFTPPYSVVTRGELASP